jgi:hypothetical protein
MFNTSQEKFYYLTGKSLQNSLGNAQRKEDRNYLNIKYGGS